MVFLHIAANFDIKVTNKKRIELARDRNYFVLARLGFRVIYSRTVANWLVKMGNIHTVGPNEALVISGLSYFILISMKLRMVDNVVCICLSRKKSFNCIE